MAALPAQRPAHPAAQPVPAAIPPSRAAAAAAWIKGTAKSY